MSKETPRITIPPGTELNVAAHEDSDSFVVQIPIEATILGDVQDGAVPIQIPEDPELKLFFHLPPNKKP